MKSTVINIRDIKANPKNPRFIKDEAFRKLVNSLRDFPQMTELRPVVVNKDMMIIGGNMRYRAAKELKWETIPVLIADNLTPEQEKEFIIKDNVSGGEWDMELLQTEWDAGKLSDWGLEFAVFDIEPTGDDLVGESKNKPATMKITFPTPEDLQKCESEIQEVINRLSPSAFYSVSAGEI